jgi:hypothetical protein
LIFVCLFWRGWGDETHTLFVFEITSLILFGNEKIIATLDSGKTHVTPPPPKKLKIIIIIMITITSPFQIVY